MEKTTNTECLAPDEVKSKEQSGETIQIIDVRSPEEFAERHIPGAVNLPLVRLEQSAGEFEKSTVYVTACGKSGGRSASGAEVLQKLGLRSAWLCGGTFGWGAEKNYSAT